MDSEKTKRGKATDKRITTIGPFFIHSVLSEVCERFVSVLDRRWNSMQNLILLVSFCGLESRLVRLGQHMRKILVETLFTKNRSRD